MESSVVLELFYFDFMDKNSGNFLLNNFFYVPQNNKYDTDLEQHEYE